MKHALASALLLGLCGARAFAQPAAPTRDDLDAAADAAAELASVPAPANADAVARADAVDLSALGLDPTSAASAVDDKLNIYGFADVSYYALHWRKDPLYFKRTERGFQVGNLNLYLARNLTARARALAEIRFTFLPNGGVNPDGTVIDTTTNDAVNFGRPVQWGGIVIERVYAEYDLTEYLTIRGGRWLTPYGIWNIDHGSPAIIGTSRPYIIGEQFFPEHQTGIDLFGSRFTHGFKVNYHLTASNGRGAIDSIQDQDNKLGFGARLEVETPWGLKLGGSYYRGRYTGLAATAGAAPPTYREQAIGGDLQLDHKGLHAQVEVIGRLRDYAAGARPATFGGDNDFGAYGLIGYRFDAVWNVMPFVELERYEPADVSGFERVQGLTGGFNFRPSGSLILKVQGLWATFADEGIGILAGNSISQLTTQASWVF